MKDLPTIRIRSIDGGPFRYSVEINGEPIGGVVGLSISGRPLRAMRVRLELLGVVDFEASGEVEFEAVDITDLEAEARTFARRPITETEGGENVTQ